MSTPPSTETPAQALARQIMERLVAKRLISADEATKLQPKLAEGKLSAEDWRLAVELVREQEATP